jgi:hypothetical protein
MYCLIGLDQHDHRLVVRRRNLAELYALAATLKDYTVTYEPGKRSK